MPTLPIIDPPYVEDRADLIERAFVVLSGDRYAFSEAWQATPEDLQEALDEHGVQYFKAVKGDGELGEVTRPHHAKVARSLGFEAFVPPVYAWPVLILLCLVADLIRRRVGSPVTMRNAWRPTEYNAKVATSGPESDHPNACGMDLDFRRDGDRAEAEEVLRTLGIILPGLEWSVGYGSRTLHVGILSPKGARSWTYSGYKGEGGSVVA